MNGAQCLVEGLVRAGVTTLFGYPGGAIMPVYDALLDCRLKHVLCRHEQAAALAADGFARASGEIGVCLATSGPGATNLVTGLANAYMDSVPIVAITGQVASPLIGTDAFQEIDIYGMTFPVVKHSFLVERVDDLPGIVQQALQIARQGRPGPVLIDIPKDIQLKEFQPDWAFAEFDEHLPLPISDLKRAKQIIESSKKPLVYLGGGVGIARAEQSLQALLHRWQVPLVSTLKGLGGCGNYEYNLGMLGMHGLKAANYAVQCCDCLIAIGARFDDRATGNLNQFAPNAKVIHIDIDEAEFDKLKNAHVSIKGEFNAVFNWFERQQLTLNITEWQNICRKNKLDFQWDYDTPGEGIFAPRLLSRLTHKLQSNFHITCDVGQHQMWVAQHCSFSETRQHLSSGGLGTMGYGLPAAIGAQLANPDGCVVNVCGDGSFAMNLQELITLKRYQMPVKIILVDNQSLGMVRQWQDLFFARRFSEIDLSDNPDFVQVANAFGLNARRITLAEEERSGLDWLLAQTQASLLHVCISNEQNVWPLVPPGAGNHQMMEGDRI